MFTSALLIGGMLVGQGGGFYPRVARNLAASPVMDTVWQGNQAINYNRRALGSAWAEALPVTTVLPQYVDPTWGPATGPVSPDVDLDDQGNYVAAWVATPPHDPYSSPPPEIYLSYNGAAPIQVSTGTLTPVTLNGTTSNISSEYASLARVTISRDGTKVAVVWAKGGTNLGYTAVNATSIWARILTIATPGVSTPSPAGLPFLVSKAALVQQGTSYPPGYPGNPPPPTYSVTDDTGRYHLGDVASDNGYLAVVYVRQENGTEAAPNQNPGVFLKGFNWDGSLRFPTNVVEQATSPDIGSGAYYTFPEIDCYHNATTGTGGFVVAYNVGAVPLYASRYDSLGNLLAPNTIVPENTGTPDYYLSGGSGENWGYGIGCRGASEGTYVVAWDFHYPDVYGIARGHSLVVGDAVPWPPSMDEWGPMYTNSSFFTDPQPVIGYPACSVEISYEFSLHNGGSGVGQAPDNQPGYRP
jgi:hypothetical protein